ncbi:MAG: extracellular solute-binding protein [Clostridia bacterium]|nr:extracellular solute-binding protein [Clostridia bacterium]
MRKTAKLISVIIVISVFLSACQGAQPEVFDVDFAMPDGGTDLEGVTVIYQMGIVDALSDKPICLGYIMDTPLGDAAVQRIKDIQTNLNCVLDIRYAYGGNNSSSFISSSASGLYLCDAAMGISDMWAEIARIGMLIGMTELEEYLDFRNEAKWGYRNMLEVIYYEDDLYGVAPMLWPEIAVTYDSPIVVNETMISSLGETDPRDYLENLQWNWDTFEECLDRYYVQEGAEIKNYSLTVGLGNFAAMFVLSNGSKFAEKDASGKYIPGFFTPNAITAMERALNIINGPVSHTIDTVTNVADALVGGTTVLGSLSSESIVGSNGRISKEMDNFGIVSWPYGPDVDPGYVAGRHHNIERCISFSRMSPHPDAAATVVDALYEPLGGYNDLDSLLDYMSKNYFYDRRDAEVYYNMYFNSCYSYFHYSGMLGYMQDWITSNKSITEYIESTTDMITSRIDEYVLPSMRGIDAVWGENN